MLEFIVLFLCIEKTGCSDALKAYRSQEPVQYKLYKDNAEKIVYKYAGKEATVAVGSMTLGVLKKDVRIKLTQGLVFTGNVDDFNLSYSIGF